MHQDLEIIKTLVSFITPVVVLILGIWAKNAATDYEKRASLNDRIIAKRVAVYDAIGNDLNDIFAYLAQVGQWKEYNPEDIISKKRAVDKVMYVNRPYWSNKAFSSYEDLMQVCFETFTGVGENAKIRCDTYQLRKLPSWQPEWQKYFSETPSLPSAIVPAKESLMRCLSQDFGYVQPRSGPC